MTAPARISCAFALALLPLAAQAAAPVSIAIQPPPALYMTDTCNTTVPLPVQIVNTLYGFAQHRFVLSGAGLSYTSNRADADDSGSTTYPLYNDAMWGFGFPPNTVVTATIQTYADSDTSAPPLYRSTMRWNCTTGEVLEITHTDLTLPAVGAVQSVPTLGHAGLALLSLGLAGLGALRRRRGA